MTRINGLTYQQFCGERKNDLACSSSVPKFVVGALAPKFVRAKAPKIVDKFVVGALAPKFVVGALAPKFVVARLSL
jgi:hypothetical protein